MSFRCNYTHKAADVVFYFSSHYAFSPISWPETQTSFEAFILRSDRSHPSCHSAVSEQNVSQTRAKPDCLCRNISPRLFSELEQFFFLSLCFHYVLNSLTFWNHWHSYSVTCLDRGRAVPRVIWFRQHGGWYNSGRDPVFGKMSTQVTADFFCVIQRPRFFPKLTSAVSP